MIEERRTTAAGAVESSEETEPAADAAAAAPEQLQATPKSQQPSAAVPKLKTPLQPTKVTEFEENKEQQAEQGTEESTEEEISKPEAEQQPEVTSAADSAPEVVVPEVVEAAPEVEHQEPDMEDEDKEKPSPRYSQLSEEEERLRTYSEISETSDDRVKFVIGETESESGSHLDLKGTESTHHHSGQKYENVQREVGMKFSTIRSKIY